MDILQKLGVDTTLLYQFAIFCVAYIFLSRFLFKPYLGAYHERIAATFGHQETAEELNQKSKDLHIQYENKAREVNTKVQQYFESAHKEARAIQATIIEKAREEAEHLIQKTRSEVEKEAQRTRAELKKLAPEIGHDINRKILSREI